MAGSGIVFILASADAWADAERRGEFAPPSLAKEGYVHASAEEALVETANRYFGDFEGDIVVLCVDVARLPASAPLRWEAASPPPGAAAQDVRPGLFPHIYGAVPASVVLAAPVLPRRSKQLASVSGPMFDHLPDVCYALLAAHQPLRLA